MKMSDSYVNAVVAGIGIFSSWAVWVSVTVFKHAQEIALLKQEVKFLADVKDILEEVKFVIKTEKRRKDVP